MFCLLLEIKWLKLNIMGSNQKSWCGGLGEMLKEVGYGILNMMKKCNMNCNNCQQDHT